MAPLRSQKSAQSLHQKSRVLRKLSPIEAFQSASHLLGLYVGCAISCRYSLPQSLLAAAAEASFESKIELTIARAVTQFPLFTVGRIKTERKKPLWLRLDQIDLNNHIKWQTVSETEDYEEALNEALEWQVNTSYVNLETQPCWRATILRSSKGSFVDIIFAWDHTAGDGKSGKMFHDRLLECFNTQLENQDSLALKDRVFEVPVTEFTPALHHLLKLPVSINFILGEFGRDLITQAKSTKPPQTANWAPIRTEAVKTRLQQITITKDSLQEVLKNCRHHETTLTALLHSLISISMAARIDENKARAFECGTPMCLRQFQQPGKYNIDLNKTAINSVVYWPYVFDQDIVATIRHQLSNAKTNTEQNIQLEATVWSTAKSIREGLSTKLKQRTKNDQVGLTKFIMDWQSFLMDHAKTRTMSWEVSNVGVLQGGGLDGVAGDADNCTIQSAIFTQAASVSGPALTFSAISVKDGAFVLSCCWQVGVVDDEMAKGVSSDIETWLNELAGTGSIRSHTLTLHPSQFASSDPRYDVALGRIRS
ncbi:hypothetical protein FHETE_9813 [Fusarium heterosporum]|uniref:Uncharacterized protein n=1 Tax=Fusarium heterosporum TaxID=42747 RepID=A0A8H5WFZ3_FUSHE|nr:hypothetical protein FHETE_9813 [Fusarium heterosporum]